MDKCKRFMVKVCILSRYTVISVYKKIKVFKQFV